MCAIPIMFIYLPGPFADGQYFFAKLIGTHHWKVINDVVLASATSTNHISKKPVKNYTQQRGMHWQLSCWSNVFLYMCEHTRKSLLNKCYESAHNDK